MRYLLDTNIVIFYFKGEANVFNALKSVGFESCAISEITVAELYYGAAKSQYSAKHLLQVEQFIAQLPVIPISDALKIYATEKARLEKSGNRLDDDFDLLIAATALSYNLVLVSNNTKHFQRIEGLSLKDWKNPKP